MKFELSNLVKTLGCVVAVGALTSCGGYKEKPPLDYIPHMADSYAVKAQHLGPMGEPMRTPVEGTVPRDFQPYRYASDPEAAGRSLKNPLPKSREVLLRGQKMYDTYCIVCHGSRGDGSGTIVPKFPRPPSLHSDKVKTWSDGRIFHVITMGQNLMPSYASQVDAADRWAIIHYVRALQRAENPSPSDLQKR